MTNVKNLNNKIQLGDTVKDTITGFTGIAISRTEFIHSCNIIEVQPKIYDENIMTESFYFDEPGLEIVNKKPIIDNNVVNIKDPTAK